MARYVAVRLLQSLPVFFMVSIIVFGFLRLMPGDPAVIIAGTDSTPEQIETLRHNYGLDRSIADQYISWLSHVVRGDLGNAFFSNRPIAYLISTRLPATIHLAIGTMIVILAIGLPIGIFAAIRPYHVFSRLVSIANALALAVPTFWLGILLLLLFGVYWRVLPTSGFVPITEDPIQSIRSLILPCLTLGASGVAVIIRYLISSITEILGSDFIRTAHAKGLPERRVIIRHVMKVALLPVVTVLAIHFGHLLSGAVITEAIFGLPGLGRLMLDTIQSHEYLVVQAAMLGFVGVFVILNIVADVIVAFLDPRIGYRA